MKKTTGMDRAATANWRPATRALRGGTWRSEHGETSEALFLTSGYTYDDAQTVADRFAGTAQGMTYSRLQNPTVAMLEERIALMEGGRMVQLGTARDIIANPANDYVADFVAHMNPLGVLTATDLAVPGRADDAVPHVPDSTPVREVMELLTQYPEVALTNGTKITRESVISKLIDPRG